MTPHPFKRSSKPGASWYVAFMVRGKTYQFSTKTDDLSLAKKRGKDYRHAIVTKNYGLANSMKQGGDAPTIGDLLTAYLALPSPCEATRKRNVAAMRLVMAASRLKDHDRVAQLGAGVVDAYQKRCMKERPDDPSAAISCNSTVRQARSIFSKDSLARYEAIPLELPKSLAPGFCGVRMLKEARMPIELPSQQAQDRAWKELTGDARRAYILARMAGLRAGEIKEARRSWITGNVLTVGPNPAEFIPKGNRSRQIAMPQEAIDELLLTEDPVYLVGPDRNNLVDRVLPRLLLGLGFPKKKPLHSIRRLFGSIIYTTQGGWQAKTALGHASLSTTESHYAKALNMPAAVQWVG